MRASRVTTSSDGAVPVQFRVEDGNTSDAPGLRDPRGRGGGPCSGVRQGELHGEDRAARGPVGGLDRAPVEGDDRRDDREA